MNGRIPLYMILFTVSTLAWSAETLMFGAIATVNPHIVEKRFQPLFAYLEEKLGRKIVFETAPTYDRTIEDFINGRYDIGWIGPSPYVIAMNEAPGSLKLIAALKGTKGSMFHGVVIVRKDAPFTALNDLKSKKFAFGSPNSTLSYYVPKHMLQQAGVYHALRAKQFFGRHDKVVKQVIMGKSDAGGVKQSVASKYSKYVKVIAKSEPIPDFAIVCRHDLDAKLQQSLTEALLELKDLKALRSIKKDAIGFEPRKPDDYLHLKHIMYETQNSEAGK